MRNLNFRQLVEQHPEILTDRHKLSFSVENISGEAASHFLESGVVMLRDVIPPETLRECRHTFGRFVSALGKKSRETELRQSDNALAVDDGPSSAWDKGETESGSWHPPWVVRY